MEKTNPICPMTAEEFYESRHWKGLIQAGVPYLFAEAYATYRLLFEREQQNSWMPTEKEWKQYPEAKCAAMDSSGKVYAFSCNLEDLKLGGSIWHENCLYYFIKKVSTIHLNWTKCRVARPK